MQRLLFRIAIKTIPGLRTHTEQILPDMHLFQHIGRCKLQTFAIQLRIGICHNLTPRFIRGNPPCTVGDDNGHARHCIHRDLQIAHTQMRITKP